MTDEQINKAIAEVRGWTECEHVESIGLTKGYPPVYDPLSYGTYENGMAQIPNYTGCLNAIHEVEKVLTRYQQTVTYSDNLIKIVGYGTFDSIHATARQKAEAFLRTLARWEEEA